MRELLLLASYIERSDRFPQPLSHEEEEKYLERYLSGDEEARMKLIEHNLRLVVHIAKKYHNSGREMDDLICCGNIGLVKAINTYNREKGTQLGTYAARCIDNEMLMLIRKSKKEKMEVSLHGSIGKDNEGNDLALIDILSTGHDDVIDMITQKLQVERLINLIEKYLNDREQKVIIHRFGLKGNERMTQNEIGFMLGISRSYVSRIETKAIEVLNSHLQES